EAEERRVFAAEARVGPGEVLEPEDRIALAADGLLAHRTEARAALLDDRVVELVGSLEVVVDRRDGHARLVGDRPDGCAVPAATGEGPGRGPEQGLAGRRRSVASGHEANSNVCSEI